MTATRSELLGHDALSDDINMNLAVKYEQQPYQQLDASPETSGLVKLVYKLN